ncbi:hypothetical protein E2562_009597 [Oryza meyeriana var. granulata]|uniref:Uncharacterized protein n=1 Tax=Oryza meyeriana var. granulata TaxID=110450 RepID=A0A6G1F5Y8_9ORYZ|nr:hypothetical protein E2562_009597 [Oryza meyeriana var. granulata]
MACSKATNWHASSIWAPPYWRTISSLGVCVRMSTERLSLLADLARGESMPMASQEEGMTMDFPLVIALRRTKEFVSLVGEAGCGAEASRGESD